jgi:very-short-patch-repair endonuclease
MSPLDKIVAVCQQSVEDRLRGLHDFDALGIGDDSPIEKFLFIALFGAVYYTDCEFTELLIVRPGNLAETRPRITSAMYLRPQAPVDRFRIDFVVEVFDGEEWQKLAVECDGHDFHEKTRKQAARDKARDRVISMSDHAMFRFTGSEIYADPMKCAGQIIEWGHRNYWRKL